MIIEKRGKSIVIKSELNDNAIACIVNSGYRIEKRAWGYIVVDPTMKFKWEVFDMFVDIKKILGQ